MNKMWRQDSFASGSGLQNTSGSIQDSWVQDFESNEHDAWFTSSASGWTSDEIGFKWLEEFFDRKTRDKARRQWRLLFVDGHGSHVTLKFLEWAQAHKILVAVYPLHSTHSLQPLDVDCFAPLATYYSQFLEEHTRLSEGQTRMRKRDFFRYFYPAWHTAFTSENIASSWSKTGLFPFDPALVVDRLKPPSQTEALPRGRSKRLSSSPSAYLDSPSGVRRLRRFVNKIVDRKTKKIIKRLSDDLQKSKAEAILERVGKQQAMEALRHEKKKRKRGKKLIEQFRADEGSGSILFSPGKVKAALELQDRREQAKEQEQVDKEQRMQERALAKVRKEQEAQKRREDRAIAQAARKTAKALQTAQRKAEKAARKARKQAELDLKAQNKRPRGRPRKQLARKETVAVERPTSALEGAEPHRSRSGRILRVPVHLLE